ncbi:MAG: bifunctional glutamine synthetase adenylyltransferase/deadenyltransferase [Candidatus Muproteobacteria bacterium RBG_16_65_34]|uniref:Bifunctional glutamine synthetase adenylyltransferase/adenylyl-removing enzyme n=1 Tax=Candidatus Muproteobacteria bacterium RBG_16_65_34 TaxID=1817760 RepID=A0A1F6TNJ1_9PROT|nr:MAG: bifunctional glutamine synthetase adenylyltransferase/deadenyltransferase [Candidatus Muproteobacteria bacterium RBG_16_65_34]
MEAGENRFTDALAQIPLSLRALAEDDARQVGAQLSDLGAMAVPGGDWVAALPRVFVASEFVTRTCVQHPEVLRELIESRDLLRAYAAGELGRRIERELAGVPDEPALKSRLRLLRRREMLRLAFRDLAGWADLDEVVTAATELADACLAAALEHLNLWATARHGAPVGVGGAPAAMVVLGLGKLGGRELNFSSDIDLVFAYTEEGETARGLSNHEFFVRLGQSLINALNEATAEGFVFRVDMRLRPNGASGPLALSFDALEHYYQTHGREWERYALIKARVCAGSRAAGEELRARLKPFVFRKYLDYGTLEGIRAMKSMIAREVERKGMQGNIKLGPGGIREIEFLAQALQLIRGGREPQLQEPALLKVLPRLAAAGHIGREEERELAAAYVFLRNVEHRLQMADDRQTQQLPSDERERLRLAFAAGFADWATFEAALARHRHRVQELFAGMFAPPPGAAQPQAADALGAVWPGPPDADAAQQALRRAGYPEPAAALALLEGLRSGPAYGAFSAEGKARMDRLVPLMLAAAGASPDPQTTLARLVNLLEAIGRRSAYLALLIENPMALAQLVKLLGASPWIAGWVAQHPIVLDELLDPRSLYEPLTHARLTDELRQCLAHIPAEDLELQMEVLREFRHSHVLRVAAAAIAGGAGAPNGAGPGLAPEQVGAHLAWIAEAAIEESLDLVRRALIVRHGAPRCPDGARPGFVVVGYGKLGGLELGYASDLDMIFIYEGCEDGATEGARSLPNETFFARLGQRLIHVLTTRTPGGILYEVDMRLRPSGKSGPLVTSLEAFRAYQQTHAWTWEHQALVRARAVAGDPGLRRGFEEVRRAVLCQARDPARLKREVLEMRAKMAQAHGAGDPVRFDLKHDAGGIVDIEFMVQYGVLRWAHEHPVLARHTDNIQLLEALAAAGRLNAGQAQTLAEAYRRYLSLEHRTRLMERGSQVDRAELGDLPERVRRIWDEVFEKGEGE